jgi:hypothetical protein
MEMRTAVGLARALGVSLDWLVLGAGERPSAADIRRAVRMAQAESAA